MDLGFMCWIIGVRQMIGQGLRFQCHLQLEKRDALDATRGRHAAAARHEAAAGRFPSVGQRLEHRL